MADITDLIATGVKPPQVDDIKTAQAKQLTLGNLMNQSALQKQQLAEGAITLAQAQKDQADSAAVDDAMAANSTTGPDGAPRLDRPGVISQLTTAGRGIAAQRVQAQFDASDVAKAKAIEAGQAQQTSALQLDSARNAKLGQLALDIQNAKTPDDQEAAYQNLHTQAARFGLMPPQALAAEIQANPHYTPALDPHVQTLIDATTSKEQQIQQQNQTLAGKKDQDQIDKDKLDLAEKWRANVTSQLGNTLSQQDYATTFQRLAKQAPPDAFDGIPDPASWTPDTSKSLARASRTPEQNAQLDAAATAAARDKTETELAVDATDPAKTPAQRQAASDALDRLDKSKLAARPVTQNNFGGSGTNAISDDDIKRAGEEFARTGTMAAMGNGNTPVRNAIIHAGQEYERQAGLSPAQAVVMRAAYKGDARSLANFQGQRDQIVSFEKTASKNIDQFLALAAKIPDTGVPWANTPLRMLNKQLVGDQNLAAIDAARQIADNEVAKVTAGGSMSAVLSDRARQDVKDYNPANATFAQTRRVVQVLRQDMANRHTSMDDTLSDIKSRIGGDAPAAAAPATTPATAPQYKKGDTVMYQGKPHQVTDVVNGKLVLAP